MSTTLLTLRQRLSENIGDYFTSTVTTAIAASTSVIDTALANVEGGGTTDYFEDWWVYFTSGANIGVKRKVSSYNAGTWTLTVLGGNLATDGAVKATYELHRVDPDKKIKAINNAARTLSSDIKRDITDISLVSGNILPDFNWWTGAAAHKFWASSTMTLARTSPGSGYTRGGRYSMKVTDAGAGDEYVSLHSDNYPRLLDLKGKTVSAYVWAYPVTTDDDPEIEIYTAKGDSTGADSQTLTSTTETESGYYQIVKLENQAIDDDIDTFEIRLKCVTASAVIYFQEPRITGVDVYDYMLPELFQNANIRRVRYQLTGSDNVAPADDIGYNADYQEIFGWDIVPQDINGTYYNFLRLPYSIPVGRRIELNSSADLEDNMSADTDTMNIDDPKSNVLIAQACWELFRQLRGFVTNSSNSAYDDEIAYWAGEVTRLKKRLTTKITSSPIRWGI